ncbi:YqgQ family protein [Oceanobacillus halotolerans]|uniref:YqgQ family protein n=1 Tax=Oceanobacillus halotolerans TaxID=2663380 RepID=UPI0013D9243D|nr:YqgQ family protein [Oceanobacillus halotolerans]
MESIYDIQQLLKRFGTFIYTGNRLGDIELMESELNELKKMAFIQPGDYQKAILLLRKEKRRLSS